MAGFKHDRGDDSEIRRQIEATKARDAQTQAERGYGDPRQGDMFGEMPVPAVIDHVEFYDAAGPSRASVAELEAKLTIAWKAHEKLLASGIDPKSPRVRVSERKLIDELHAYERADNLEYYQQMQSDGRRP